MPGQPPWRRRRRGGFQALNRAGVWLGLAWTLLLVALAGWRLLQSTAARRRVTAPVLIPAVVYLTLVAWDFQHALDRGFLSNDAVDRRLWLGQAAALVALAVGVSWEWVRGGGPVRRWRGWWSSSRPPPPPGGLGAILADTLDDPSLQLLYPLPDGRRVDARGRPAQPGQEQAVTPPSCVAGGRSPCSPTGPASSTTQGWSTRSPPPPASRWRTSGCKHRSAPSWKTSERHAPGSSNRATPNAGGWSATSTTAPSNAWSPSRSRCGSPGSGCEPPRPTPQHWRKQRPRSAKPLRSLRGLAHGLYPAALTEEGLGAALEALAEQASSPCWRWGRCHGNASIRTLRPPPTSWSPRPLNRSRPGRTAVDAARGDGRLVLKIVTDQPPPQELTDLEDRVGALDGRLLVQHGLSGGTRIRAELPCG